MSELTTYNKAFTRTDSRTRYSWVEAFRDIQPGDSKLFPDHEYTAVRMRAIAYTRKHNTVLETGIVDGVTAVRRPVD